MLYFPRCYRGNIFHVFRVVAPRIGNSYPLVSIPERLGIQKVIFARQNTQETDLR